MTDTPHTTTAEAPFDPAPRRYRHDGWTPAKQWMFVQTLADTGSVDRACQMVNMTESSAYRLRRHPDAGDFRRAWEDAIRHAWTSLDQIVIERIRHGETRIIDHKDGRSTIIRTPCSDRLLISALKHQERQRERADAKAEQEAARATELAQARAMVAARFGEAPPAPVAAATPESTMTRVCEAFHVLTAGLTDKPDWEGPPYIFADDIPPLPRAPRLLAPASGRLPMAAKQARWRAGVAAAAVAAGASLNRAQQPGAKAVRNRGGD